MAIHAVPPSPPGVMIVGHGFMGANHRRKVEQLEAQGRAHLVAVIDIDPTRLTDLKVPTAASMMEGLFASTLPDIIIISANTKAHFILLQQVLDLSRQHGKVPHILNEKPLVAKTSEGEAIRQLFADYTGHLSSGYLFRYSPIIETGIQHLKDRSIQIRKITTIWQKDRLEKGPVRPSEGVHIDEATHSVDLIINCILPQVGIQADGVTLINARYWRQSEIGLIVDQKKQEELYHDDPSKLDPVAQVEYELECGGIPISGFSSFKKAPQRREISVECADGTALLFEFDVQGCDRLYEERGSSKTLLSETKADKLMLEWEAFLHECTTGESSYRTQRLHQLLFDIRLTEALGQDLTFPHTLSFL